MRRLSFLFTVTLLVVPAFAADPPVAAPKQGENTAALVERGRAAIGEKKYDEAIRDLTEALRLDPDSTDAYAWRAKARINRGEYDRALADCDEALQRKPDLVFALIQRADACRWKGLYERAIADCDTALMLNPKASGAYGIRGCARLRQQDPDRAVADLTEALRLAPRYVFALTYRGEAYTVLGKYDAAIADLSEALRLDPAYTYAYICRGDAYRLKGETDKAIADCNEALKQAPKSGRAYATRAASQMRKRRYDEAILDFTEALRLDPRYVFALTYRGETYRLQGKLDLALKDLTKAIEINPAYASAYQFRSRIHQARGDSEPAAADWDKAMQLNPRMPHPFVALDAGGHTARVMQVLFAPDGKELISVSLDKTIRSWDIQTGEALDVLRLPINQGRVGMLYAVALSPDGKILATGDFGSAADKWGTIYLINLVTRRIERVLTGHTNVIDSLAFSPDGKRLASGSHDQTARLWEIATGTCERTLQGHDKEIYGVAFSPDGCRLATASFDRTARIWSVTTGKCEAVLAGHTGEVRCIAWSPDGHTIATGSWDQSLRLWDADGKARQSIEKHLGSIQSVAFSPDGRKLLVTRTGRVTDCFLLDLATGEEQVHFLKHPAPTGWMSGVISPDGRLAATALGNVYLWRTTDGSVLARLAGKGEVPWSAAWSLDGRTIAWGNTRPYRFDNDRSPLERIWSLPDLELRPVGDMSLRRAQSSRGSWSLEKTGRTTVTVKRGSETVSELKLSAHNDVKCFTLLPDDRAAVGDDFGLYLFDIRTGKRLRTFWGHTDVVWAVAPSPDNRYLLSASSDQTLRIWDSNKSWPLLTLFVAGSEWVAWTPEGYYAASPGGERLMGWHLNNGPDQLASFYPAAQFHKSLYRPDVIRLLLDAGSVVKALERADKGNGKKSEYVQANQVLPPRVVITAPAATTTRIAQARIKVRAKASSVGDHPVTSLRLLVNGRPYKGQAGLQRLAHPQLGEVEVSWNVELSRGVNRLRVEATSPVSTVVSEELVLDYGPPGQRPPSSDLYVLAIGINGYPGAAKLDCAVADAEGLTKLFRRQQGGSLYRQIHTRLLTDQNAKRQDVLQGLRWLRDQVQPFDVVVVFYAGHGTLDAQGRFYLLPADMDFGDLAHSAVSGDELKKGLAELPGRVLLLLDACHAGKIGEAEVPGLKKRGLRSATDDFVRELSADEYGVVVMCAAQGRQESGEDRELGHGYFTQALLDGLAGKADYGHRGVVRLTALDDYVSERVRELSLGAQTPCTGKPTTISSFPIVAIRP